MPDSLAALFDAWPPLAALRDRAAAAPEAAILAALGLALLLTGATVLWRRARPFRALCEGLRGDLSDRTAERDDARARHAAADAENRGLALDGARLVTRIEGLEARLDDAAADRARHAAAAAEDRAALAAELAEARDEVRRLSTVNEGLAERLRQGAERHEADMALLRDLRAQMTADFHKLSNDALRDQGERFGQLNRERVDALLKPMREQVGHFQTELREAHLGAAKDRERLKAEIEALSRRSEEVGREAVALTNALKGDKQRQGAWGEMVLERLLEECGLSEGREYETQGSVRREDGTLGRPDVVVRLPGDRAVVIDAKVSLVAYEAAVNAEDDATRRAQARAHVAALRKHVTDLRDRDYAELVDGSVDYVVMFMPIEGALQEAVAQQPDLTAWAMSQRVAIATPLTLMPLLRTVEHIWTVDQRQRNAEEIAARAGHLFDKMAGVVESFSKVGDALDRAKGSHDEALDRLSRGNGNVLRQFEMLRRLGARTSKTLAVEGDDAADDAPALPPADAAE